MGKIIKEFTTEYDVGDIVIFEKDNTLNVGIIEGYYVEDNCVWYNIRISPSFVYTYSNGGDIGEFDIIGILDDTLKDKCIKCIFGDNPPIKSKQSSKITYSVKTLED